MTKQAKEKNNKQQTGTPKEANKLHAVFLRSAIISLLLITASFLYLAVVDRPTGNAANIQNLSNRLADNQAFLLNQHVEQIQKRLTQMASNPELIAALTQKNTAKIAAFNQEIKRGFPQAISTQLIALGPLGIAGVDKDSKQLRNNIERDLLRRVSNKETVAPESYRFNKQSLFTFSQAIIAETNRFAAGALIVSYNNSELNDVLRQLDTTLGQTLLIQKINNEQTLIKIGEGAPGFTAIQKPTSVAHWQLSFTPSSQLIANNSSSTQILWILLAVSILAIIAALSLAISGAQKAITDNLAQLSARNAGPYTLPGFTEAAAQQLSDLNELQARAKHEAAKTQQALAESSEPAEEAPTANQTLPNDIPTTIFRAYDIRGIADQELTDSHCFAIGIAIGSEARDHGQEALLVAADGRHSSPRIRDSLCKGIQASGCDVIDIGTVPSPVMYFATHQLETQSGIMITGSHNPPEYNGIKIVLNGQALSGAAIRNLRERVLKQNLHSGQGSYRTETIEDDYIDYIINDVAIAQPLKIIVDAGNGVTGAIAPRLFEELGCEVIPLYCEIDGDFPNHHPDPTVAANLEDLITQVKEQSADLGIAFDGDGDRLGVVTASGNIVAADRLLMLLAQDVVSRNPGADILFDVKCTRSLTSLISNYGGRPIMWKTGHSYMKEKMVETGALLGGEFSGHIFFKERWFGFDDGMYAAARLIEILSTTDPDLDAHLDSFPNLVSTPELKVASDELKKFAIIEQLTQLGNFGDGKVSTLDGVRVDFPEGWGLVRASNTTPMLVLRFEADTDDALAKIQTLFKDQLAGIDGNLEFNF